MRKINSNGGDAYVESLQQKITTLENKIEKLQWECDEHNRCATKYHAESERMRNVLVTVNDFFKGLRTIYTNDSRVIWIDQVLTNIKKVIE